MGEVPESVKQFAFNATKSLLPNKSKELYERYCIPKMIHKYEN